LDIIFKHPDYIESVKVDPVSNCDFLSTESQITLSVRIANVIKISIITTILHLSKRFNSASTIAKRFELTYFYSWQPANEMFVFGSTSHCADPTQRDAFH